MGSGGPGMCEICQRDRPHVYRISAWYDPENPMPPLDEVPMRDVCPECSHLAAREHLSGFTGAEARA